MDKDWSVIGLSCLGALALLAIITVVVAFLITIVWSWVIPDVFAGAVQQGILPASITWFQALKLRILLSVFGLSGRSSSSSKK